MKKFLPLFALALLGFSAESALAGGCPGPFCGNAPGMTSQFHSARGPFSHMFHSRPVPAFQAAPWYLYWPYQAHFMSAAPLPGTTGYPGYPGHGGTMANPYFPGQQPAYVVPPTNGQPQNDN